MSISLSGYLFKRTAAVDAVLNSVLYLGALCVVEAVYGTYKVAGDAADTLEGNIVKGVAHIDILAVDRKGYGLDVLIGILLFELLYIRIDLCFCQVAACYCNCHVDLLIS